MRKADRVARFERSTAEQAVPIAGGCPTAGVAVRAAARRATPSRGRQIPGAFASGRAAAGSGAGACIIFFCRVFGGFGGS